MKELILEILKEYKSKNPVKEYSLKSSEIRNLIKLVYPECDGTNIESGCYGKMTDDNCQTDFGVIGGNYSEKKMYGDEYSDWSIINRFDTNSKVHSKIYELYKKDNNQEINFNDWLKKNTLELFNGKYTQLLVDLNSETLSKGYDNENYSKKVLRQIYGNDVKIKQHCAGDYRDRKLGQDLDVIINDINHYFQIKPIYGEIKKYNSDRGVYYKVPSYNKSDKYKEENVDVIMYVKDNKEYILFNNDYRYILTVGSDSYQVPYYIYYYENPTHTNMNLPIQTDEKIRKIKPSLSHSKEILIKQYEDRINQLTVDLEKLKNNKNPNQLSMFEDISQELHINKKRLKRLIG
jgi:DNA-directed RNA polymerase subunit L